MYQDSFLVSNIMCAGTCLPAIDCCLKQCFKTCQENKLLSPQAELFINAEVDRLGFHQILITITGDESCDKNKLSIGFKAALCGAEFSIVDKDHTPEESTSSKINGMNILSNVVAITGILVLSIIFPPSLLLTVGLTTLTVLTSAFTARYYLFNFLNNLRQKSFANMATTITLGWALSAAHTLYHAITMVLIGHFSMIMMGFVMPLILIAMINGMDELKNQISKKSTSMRLKSLKTLFPEMSDDYYCYLPEKTLLNKNLLKPGMTIEVNRGECFPVDCCLLSKSTSVDNSIVNGELQETKRQGDTICSGAINLGDQVLVKATLDAFHSHTNKLLFRANRATETNDQTPNRIFHYVYTTLIILGLVTAVVTPFALGILTIPLLLQNITGILFAICPCTLALAHQLPVLLSHYQRGEKGIKLRNDDLCERMDKIHTIIVDKTGTLSTGECQIESIDGLSPEVFERVYLLEKNHAATHPLARAITSHYEKNHPDQPIIKDIENVSPDEARCGLKGTVQGKIIHIGNWDYLSRSNIKTPLIDDTKLTQGFSAVYVAENYQYQGVIYIKHELREDIAPMMSKFREEKKIIIMLTGDNEKSASGFNDQHRLAFTKVLCQQTPSKKEQFISKLTDSGNPAYLETWKDILSRLSDKDKIQFLERSSNPYDPKGIWFVGDGLNDALCAREVSKKGGVSCAMTSTDRTSFFTDISLNGGLQYLSQHNDINGFLKKNVLQNQGLLLLGSIASLVFIISFSLVGLALSPIIPLMIMSSTTLMVLFNSYRVRLHIDSVMENHTPWIKRLLASDLSIALLAGGCVLFMASLLITTLATGGLALPVMNFGAGVIAALSSSLVVGASACFAFFTAVVSGYLISGKSAEPSLKPSDLQNHYLAPQSPLSVKLTPKSKITHRDGYQRLYEGETLRSSSSSSDGGSASPYSLSSSP